MRVFELVFAAAEKLIVPLPPPLLTDVMVSQLILLLAVHAQPTPLEVKSKLPVPLPTGTEAPVDESVNAHPAATWFTVKVWPAIVSVPLRGVTVGFAATL